MKEQAYNKDKDQFQDSRNQCQSNLKKPKVEGFKDLASGEIVSLKILSQTRKLGHSSRKLRKIQRIRALYFTPHPRRKDVYAVSRRNPYAVFKYKSWNILSYNNRGPHARNPNTPY
ncbi:hypothetical protein Tco_0348426 [Tanacetum coccineum]